MIDAWNVHKNAPWVVCKSASAGVDLQSSQLVLCPRRRLSDNFSRHIPFSRSSLTGVVIGTCTKTPRGSIFDLASWCCARTGASVTIFQGTPLSHGSPWRVELRWYSLNFPRQNKTVGFGQQPRPLHSRCTRTDACARWGMAVACNRY
jgi:hypothetical protein